jgi:hypothetical protein
MFATLLLVQLLATLTSTLTVVSGAVPAEPIYVQTCVDTLPGESILACACVQALTKEPFVVHNLGSSTCETGSLKCNLRAAVALCIEVAPAVVSWAA